MKSLLLLSLFYCTLLIGVHASCSVDVLASARQGSGGSWDDGGIHYQIYDITITNNGNTIITSVTAMFAVGAIKQVWNYNATTGAITGFYELNPGSSWSGAGMIVEGHNAPVLDSAEAGCKNSPTKAPTHAPTQPPTPTPQPQHCKAEVTATYDPRIPNNLFRLNVTNTGSEIITGLIATFHNATGGYNYNVTTGALTAIYNLFPGQFNTYSGVYISGPPPMGYPATITPTSVVPTCKKLTVSTCEPTSARTCTTATSKVKDGPSFTEHNTTAQKWTVTIMNTGTTPITSTTVSAYMQDYMNPVIIDANSVVGLRQFSQSPTDCNSLACLSSFMGQYIVLLPSDYLCAGATVSVSFVVYGNSAASADSFSIGAANTLCY